jgi:hypothetical protein
VYGFPNAAVAAVAAEASWEGYNSCDPLALASSPDVVAEAVVISILLRATVAMPLAPVSVPSRSGGRPICRASAEPAAVCPSVDVLLLVIPVFVIVESLDQMCHARKTSC